MLSCSASPSTATNWQKSFSPQKAAGWGSAKPQPHSGFTSAFRGWWSFHGTCPGQQELVQLNTSKSQEIRAACAQGFTFSCPSATLSSYPVSNTVPKAEESLTHSLSWSSVIHTCGLGLWKKNITQQFNFPIVYGQILLLAERAVNF